MKLPLTLSLYIARQCLIAVLMVLLGLLFIGLLIDVVELARRAASKDQIPFSVILQMALLRLPQEAVKLAPFAALIGGMIALTRLTRSSELVVARAVGVSVWQFLTPALGVAAALGVVIVTMVTPISAATLLRFERLEGRWLTGHPSLLSVSSSGLWLRQVEERGDNITEHIIYALRVSQTDMSFSSVILFAFDKDSKFVERLDAERAVLEPGELRLSQVVRSLPGQPPEHLDEYTLPTDLKVSQIKDSFASPETMSFWHLPAFIAMLEKAGFSALRHRLYWHSLLAEPFLLCAMLMLSAIFSLRPPRRGRIGLLVATGMVTGFFVHFMTDVVYAFGSAGTLPVPLAAWSPAAVILMASTATLLHLEDG